MYVGAKHVDARHGAGLFLIDRAIEQRFGRVDFGLDRIRAGAVRNDGEISVADGLHHEIACFIGTEPRRFQAFGGGFQILQRASVIDCLLREGTGVLVTKWADDGRNLRHVQTKGHQIALL